MIYSQVEPIHFVDDRSEFEDHACFFTNGFMAFLVGIMTFGAPVFTFVIFENVWFGGRTK